MRVRHPGSPLLALLAFAGEPAPAAANPITHIVQGSPSRITGSFSATIDIDVVTNWGTASSGAFALSGALTGTTAKPTGSVDVEWGQSGLGRLDLRWTSP